MYEKIFQNKKPNENKLLAFGFVPADGGHILQRQIAGGEFTLAVSVDSSGAVTTKTIATDTGDEYVLHKTAAEGAFVGRLRAEIDAALTAVAAECFDDDTFKSAQTKRVLAYAKEKYGDEPEFLWKKFPDNAVLRRSDTKKWYAAILTTQKSKLGLDANEKAEIIDLRIKPELMAATLTKENFYPGWHMNKKHWYTIILNGLTADDELLARLDESYRLAAK